MSELLEEDAADFENQSEPQEILFQSHAVNQLFLTLSHRRVQKVVERERLFCLETH